MSTCTIHWFRRDLRFADNPALTTASQRGQHRVIALFVVDEQLVNSPRVGPNRLAFLADRLRTLHAELQQHGSSLLICYGDPADVIVQLCQKHGAAGVTWQADSAPWARRRDQQVADILQQHGVATFIHDSQTIMPATKILTDKGTPYTVFTPFYRNWSRQLRVAPVLPIPPLQMVAGLPTQPQWPNWPTTIIPLPDSHASTAQQLLSTFTDQRINDYGDGRNLLAQTGTSMLSPYLRFGIISPQECARAAITAQRQAPPSAERSGAEVWLSELAWRDFYQQILYHFPHVTNRAFRPMYDDLAWDNNPDYFAAWCQGMTGYPIVDAAMRQLNSTGWMHNRARMIVASFLTKDLLIDWRWGERYFMQQLIDGDTAANNGGWQWSAGTGTDAQPYFRIFNPISQGETFDPDGTYVKRYIPELANVPTKYIHAPWLMPPMLMHEVRCLIGHDYPAPIVDHATQRVKALAMYKLVRPE